MGRGGEPNPPRLGVATFEDTPLDLLPPSWQSQGGIWRVSAEEGARVLRQAMRPLLSNALATFEWANYAVAAEFRVAAGEGRWGAGVVGYWVDRQNHYRLCVVNDALHLVKVQAGRVESLSSVRRPFQREKWYRVEFRLRTEPGRVTLRGKVWPVGEKEPPAGLEATDGQTFFQRGSVGLWSGHSDSLFRGLTVTSLADHATLYQENFAQASKGSAARNWKHLGGHWVVDRWEGQPVYRQMRDETGPDFDDNAFAVLEWRDYAVYVRVKADPTEGPWGVGVVGYYGDEDHHYRLRCLNGKLELVKRNGHGRTVELSPGVPCEIQPAHWWWLLLRLENRGGAVILQGKAWPAEEPEPLDWALVAVDAEEPLSGGAAGLWAVFTTASFDDLTITSGPLP